MSDSNVPPTGDQANAQAQGPMLQTIAQYLKDLSFENPSPLDSLTQNNPNPTVNVNVTVKTRVAKETLYEVAVIVQVHTLAGDKTLFLIEMTYCGLFALVNVPQDQIEPILRVHCAGLMFPFIRSIVADATHQGSFAPLYLNMIDFAALYQQTQAGGAATGGGNVTA